MKKVNQRGSVDIWLILFILVCVLLIGSVIFGFWAFSSRQDYKDNTDQKVSVAVEDAVEKANQEKDKYYFEREKEPYRDYVTPAPYGAITLKYPKTWSAYVNEASSNVPVDAYFHPSYVPSVLSSTVFAIRAQVVAKSYENELKFYDSFIKAKKVKVSTYQAPKVGSVTGSKIEGDIFVGKKGTLILLPLRDKTIKIWTEASQYTKDLTDIVLANLTFVP